MATIIKAADRSATDLDPNGERHLERAREQAGAILAEARREAADIRAEAEEQGRSAAQNAAESALDGRIARQLESLLPALRQAAAGIEEARAACLVHWEGRAVHLAASIAERVIRRELTQSPDITLTLIQEALDLAAGSAELRIHLNPADHAALGPAVVRLAAEASTRSATEVVADPSVTSGGCRVQTRFGMIDQSIETQLARIVQELTH